jgi:hypothetical protein
LFFNFRFNKDAAEAYIAPFPTALYMGGVAKWPLLVPLYRDDPVAQHMVEARNCLKTWNKPALIMFGDEGEFAYEQLTFLKYQCGTLPIESCLILRQ